MRRVLIFLLTATMAASTAYAQGRGGRGGQPQVVSPEVHDDGRITLRFRAPDADQITVSGELDGESHPMTRGEDGVWTVTVGPLTPDIYTYAFNVDGVTALDPRNTNTKMGYGGFGPVSVVQVPGDGPQFYDVRDVPHGTVRILPYVSETLGGLARMAWVYTPPSYAEGDDFPALYLLHGAGDIESGWTLIGRANNILDNLIADGSAREMVVVMPLGYPIQSFYAGPSASYSPPEGQGEAATPLSPFARDLLEELMPLVEERFKVSTAVDDRAIGGLSMGGGHTLNVAFNRPELFRYVVLMSPVAFNASETYQEVFSNPERLNSQFQLLWMAVGEDDNLTGPGDRELHETMTSAGVNHTFLLTPGRHEWTVWRHHLRDVAPLLFK